MSDDDPIERGGDEPRGFPQLPEKDFAYIEIVSSPTKALVGRIVALSQRTMTIGRWACSTIYAAVDSHGARMSRGNTMFELEDGRFVVSDAGSTYGTSVNGVRLPPGRRRVLEPGDTIDVGGEEQPDGSLAGHARVVFLGKTPPKGRPIKRVGG